MTKELESPRYVRVHQYIPLREGVKLEPASILPDTYVVTEYGHVAGLVDQEDLGAAMGKSWHPGPVIEEPKGPEYEYFYWPDGGRHMTLSGVCPVCGGSGREWEPLGEEWVGCGCLQWEGKR